MLDPLVPSLSRTRGKSNDFNKMNAISPACPGLIRRDKEQGGKKANEINACSLSPLVPLKGVAGAVQAAPPFSRLPSAQEREGNNKGKQSDRLSGAFVKLEQLRSKRQRYLNTASKIYG
jgi:hypothetical protein